jgi:hypothetical protein
VNACHPAKRLSRHSSAPLDDEHGLIVNTVLFANLAETIVFFPAYCTRALQISFVGWR